MCRFPANESLRRTGLHCLFWQNPVFTFLRLISPVHVVHPLRNKETNKLGGQHKMYQRATVLDVARQPLWRYVKGRLRNCDDTCSFATNVKKYNFFFLFVAKHHVSIQLRCRPLTYRHRGRRATSQCAFKFLVANVTYKMNPHFFTTKRWNRFFAIYVVRLALYVYLKNICDGVGGQDESNGTPLYPPLFWLDNIFKRMCYKTFTLQS